jgi:hypothetical protein
MKYSRIVIMCLISVLLTACGGAPQKAPSDVAIEGTVLRLAEKGSDIEIQLDNAVDLYGLHVHVEFDPNKIQVRDADPDQEGIQIAPGILPSPDFIALNMVDNEYGMIDYAVVQTNPRQPASGSGVVAVIHVEQSDADANPFTVLHIELAGPDGNKLPVQIAHGG